MKKRLLILGCSATKSSAPGLIPAVDRYAPGAMFQMLHKVPRDLWPDIIILSARYGYMDGLNRCIPNYDQRLDKQGARALIEDPEHWATFRLLVKPYHSDIFIGLSQLYRSVIDYHFNFSVRPPNASILYSSGGIGTQRGQLKKWLSWGL